ncbi:glutathione S-transferase LANCL1-like [Convolutriloba macropyga]|uniref:glutathione S-transferase LANCL1-like n=1 Tax=Convolutriloba macropyga TaxID=536237 RepID=UPI003F51ED34
MRILIFQVLCGEVSRMPSDERAFVNSYVTNEPSSFSSEQDVIPSNFRKRIEKFLFEKLKVLRENLNDGNISVKDVSVYTGLSGIALMLIKLEKSQILKDKIDFSLKDLAFKITKHNDSKKSSAFTYLCGAPGALYVKALSGAEAKSLEPKNLKDILDLGSSLCHSGSGAYDEYLYGRAGYLGCLVFMAKSFPTQKDELVMDKICQAMIDSGVNSAKRNRLNQPMHFEWHESEYVGGAHGYAGIFYFLLKLRNCPSVQAVLHTVLKSALYWFLELQLDSGNYPSSIGSGRDKLVHWCHGAPSAVFTLITAYEVYGDEKFKSAALECGQCVWKRGFLKKGYGICHGTAGNAYTFLALYRATGNFQHLYRAVCFAQLCLDFDKPHRSADRPFSLFEGLAGTMYFLIDMLDHENARFPCYEFDSI